MSEESIIHPLVTDTSKFSDKLSPMLVKELRQGLKGTTFVILFIAIQVTLALLILGQSLASSYDNTGNDISTTIFVCISLATCVLQPLRAISAIRSEIKENTIDLMLITKLSAWKIVFGKWISLVSQSALIIAAITPYLILRYFFGGMQLFAELMILMSIFIASAGITGIFIGISSLPSLILRGIFGLVMAFYIGLGSLFLFLNPPTYYDLTSLCSFQAEYSFSIYSLLLIGTIYICWLALDFAAGSIAPIAENRATPRRLICLGVLTIITMIFFLSEPDFRRAAPWFIGIFSIPICIISLIEHPLFTTSTISIPFIRRGIVGRIGSYFLYPGWASGLNFVLILFVATYCSALFFHPTTSSHSDTLQELLTASIISFSCIIFPLLLTRIFFSNTTKLFLIYFIALLLTGLLSLIVIIVKESSDTEAIYTIFCWLPPIQFALFDRPSTEETAHLIALPTFFFYWIACFLTSSKYWKHMRANDAKSREIIDAEKAVDSPE